MKKILIVALLLLPGQFAFASNTCTSGHGIGQVWQSIVSGSIFHSAKAWLSLIERRI